MRIGIDLDGVLYNFGDSVKRYLDSIDQGHIWKSGPTPKPFWDFYKDWGWTGEDFVKMCNDGVDAGYIFSGPARAGAVESVVKIKSLGHDIVIVTDRQFGSRPENSHRATREWLSQHSIPFDELWFSADKTCVYTDMFVEDKLENYDALKLAGVDAYLINRAWNMMDWPNDGRNRIDDITDFANIVESKTLVMIGE